MGGCRTSDFNTLCLVIALVAVFKFIALDILAFKFAVEALVIALVTTFKV